MDSNFPRILSLLRKEKGISQKQAAVKLGVSQSLLSHYEKGIRECGLLFVLKAAEFYGVSCDYLLGRSPDRKGTTITIDDLKDQQKEKEEPNPKTLKLVYKKKILFCSLNILFDILSKAENSKLVEEVFSFLYLAVYRIFRIIFRINKKNRNEMFVVRDSVANQFAQAEMTKSEAKANILAEELNFKKSTNLDNVEITTDILEQKYPQNHNALLNLVKHCEAIIKG